MVGNTNSAAYREYIDVTTGECVKLPVKAPLVGETDRNFHKIFLKDFLKTMGTIGNQKAKVTYWIIGHLTPDNVMPYSYRQIAKKTGISYQTVARTVRTLIDADFLRRSGKVLIANPDIIFKGRYARRMRVLDSFQEAAGDKETDAKMRLRQLEHTIASLTKEAQALALEIQNMENEKKAES